MVALFLSAEKCALEQGTIDKFSILVQESKKNSAEILRSFLRPPFRTAERSFTTSIKSLENSY